MKKAIQKFLGLDKLQTSTQDSLKEIHAMRERIKNLEIEKAQMYGQLSGVMSDIDTKDWGQDIDYTSLACEVDLGELVDYLSNADIAEYIEVVEVANYIEPSEVAEYIDPSDVAEHISMDDLLEHANIDISILSEQVAERIADRDGMHELVNEEMDNRGVGITQDAVQSMIHTAIQQFADTLERAELYNEQFQDKKSKYPFREGDTYYTLEVVKSCWDEVSEDMHDSNPNQLYFKTRAEAESKIN